MPAECEHAKTDGKLTVSSGLEQVAEDLFVVNGRFSSGVTLPTRMIVIRLPEGQGLVVYSPFSPKTVDLSALGTVRAIIAPNMMHDTFAQAFHKAHPEATLYSSPSLPANHPDRDWGTVLSEAGDSDIISKYVLVRVLSGFKKFQEVILLHVPSKSLVTADMAFNFTEDLLSNMSLGARFFVWASRGTGAMNWNVIVKMIMRSGCREGLPQLDAMLNEWDWDRCIMCHGEIVHRDAKQLYREGVYKWVKQIASEDGTGVETVGEHGL